MSGKFKALVNAQRFIYRIQNDANYHAQQRYQRQLAIKKLGATIGWKQFSVTNVPAQKVLAAGLLFLQGANAQSGDYNYDSDEYYNVGSRVAMGVFASALFVGMMTLGAICLVRSWVEQRRVGRFVNIAPQIGAKAPQEAPPSIQIGASAPIAIPQTLDNETASLVKHDFAQTQENP